MADQASLLLRRQLKGERAGGRARVPATFNSRRLAWGAPVAQANRHTPSTAVAGRQSAGHTPATLATS